MASGRGKLTLLEHGGWKRGPCSELFSGSFLTSAEMCFVLLGHWITCMGFHQMWLILPGLLGPHVNIWHFVINSGFEVLALYEFVYLNSRPYLVF